MHCETDLSGGGEKVIGVLGGMGPEATLSFYGKLIANTPAGRDQDHLRVVIDSNPKVPDRTAALLQQGDSPLPMMVAGMEALALAGADFVVIPCVSAHGFLEDLRARARLPLLSMLEAAAEHIQGRHPDLKTVGLLATTGTVEAGRFEQALGRAGIGVVHPGPEDQGRVMAAIYEIKSSSSPERRARARGDVLAVAERLVSAGAGGIVLGCTELPLVLGAHDLSVPVFDSVLILARAAIVVAGREPVGGGAGLMRGAWGLCLALVAAPAIAQDGASEIGKRLLADVAVRAALDRVRANEPQILEDQVRLCEIPAPSFHEEKRGAAVKAIFQGLGLQNIRVDAVGNVLGERPGRGPRPHVVVAAHLDTVFPEGTDLTVRREGPRLRGPGIGDNCRGLAALVGVVRALQEVKVETPGTITFVADVGEEALGNLRGARHLFDTELKGRIDRFVSIDGSGIGFSPVGVGANRYRVTFKGPGGHSYFAFGKANPIHALGRAIETISGFEVPKDPRTTFSVGRVGGGTSINAIAAEAWMEVDLRSHDVASLAALDARFQEAVTAAAREENARWDGRGAVEVVVEDLGRRVAGMTPSDAPIIKAVVSVSEALGIVSKPFPSTTDSNIAMAAGIPAVTIDGGGDGTGGHSLGEVFDSTDSWKGTQRALLLTVALTYP